MCFLRRRLLKAPASFPHISKIHRNLHILLSMGTSIDVLEKLLLEKNRLPKKSGPVIMYPKPDILVWNYGILLQEILVETAVFIRGHDDFWENKDAGWSKILKRICGTAEYTHGEKEALSQIPTLDQKTSVECLSYAASP